jgi:hypothetical protein
MPTLGFHVPDDSPLAKAIKDRVAKDKAGTPSAWLRTVVEQAVKQGGAPLVTDPNVLVELTRQLMGPLDANLMEAAMKGKNQPEELRGALRKLAGLEFPSAQELAEMKSRLDQLEKLRRNKGR